MKRTLRVALGRISLLMVGVQVRLLARRVGSAGVLVLDIDNTLADTWPSLLPGVDPKDRLARLEPLPGMHAATVGRADDRPVVYLSHRFLWQAPVTWTWLRRQGYPVRMHSLMLVPTAADKLKPLGSLAALGPVEYWDDLSFGHEHGEVQFYQELIDQVRAMPIAFHDFQAISDTVDAARGSEE
jgi:hypothetical protein